jgi:hypothetical protein
MAGSPEMMRRDRPRRHRYWPAHGARQQGDCSAATASQPRATASVRPDHTASAASGLVNAEAESTGNIPGDKRRHRMLSRAEREHAHYATGHRSKLSYG